MNKRKWVINSGLVFGSLLICFIAGEILLRIIGFSYVKFQEYDSLTGRKSMPNAEGWFLEEDKVYIKMNSAGLRDREHSKKKPEDVIRIAILGDSFTEALQVEMENTFWAILERKLNDCNPFGSKKVEVINFGMSGYSTTQELLTLRYRVWDYSPDIILLAFYTGNDIRNNSKILENYKLQPFYVYQDDRLVLDNSFVNHPTYKWKTGILWSGIRQLYRYTRVVQLLTKFRDIKSSESPVENGDDLPPFDSLYHTIFYPSINKDWQQAWKITEELLGMMRDEVEQNGARFILVTLSNDIQVHPDPELRNRFMKKYEIDDLFYPENRIKKFAGKENMEVLLLSPVFKEYAEKNYIYLHGILNSEPSGFGHWNINGHRLAGEIIAEYLCSENSGPEKNKGKN